MAREKGSQRGERKKEPRPRGRDQKPQRDRLKRQPPTAVLDRERDGLHAHARRVRCGVSGDCVLPKLISELSDLTHTWQISNLPRIALTTLCASGRPRR